MSENTALVSGDTALVSEGTALVSEDTALVSVQSALVSVDIGEHNYRVVGHNSRVGGHSSRFKLKPGDLSEQVCKLAKRRSKRFCAEDRGFLSEAVQFPFGFVSWRKGDPHVSVRRIEASFRKRSNSLFGNRLKCTESAPRMHRECTGSAPRCTRNAPKVNQGVHQSAPGVHQKCTRSAPGMHQNAPGALGTLLVFLRSALLFMTWQRRMPAWGPVGLLSSVLLFITWQREGARLGTSWASQQCSAVHDLAQRMPTWEPVGLLSRILLFMTWQHRMPAWRPVFLLSSVLRFTTWQREGASLETSWSSQQCSAAHNLAT